MPNDEELKEQIELKEFLDEVEDFVKTPYKYYKDNVDFTKPLTEEEKANFEKQYIESVRIYNKLLPNDKKIELDVEGLRKRMNDPKEIEIYRRSKYLVEKEKKQLAIFQKYKEEHHIIGTEKGPLARDIFRLMRIDGSPESENFNSKLFSLYIKYPYEVTTAVLKGEYSADSSVYNGMLMDDYDRMKLYFDNFENVKISFNEAYTKTNMKGSNKLLDELAAENVSNLIQQKASISCGFLHPDDYFVVPKMNDKQRELCLIGRDPEYTKDYINKVADMFFDNNIIEARENVGLLKQEGILDDKEPILSYKAVETKDGKEKEVKIITALKNKNPNVKIVKRSEEEKEKLRYITIANYNHKQMYVVEHNSETEKLFETEKEIKEENKNNIENEKKAPAKEAQEIEKEPVEEVKDNIENEKKAPAEEAQEIEKEPAEEAKDNIENEKKAPAEEAQEIEKEPVEEAKDNIENKNNVFTFTEEEKQRLRAEYINNVNMINKGISKKENKIKPDLDNLEKRLNDPNEVKVYKLSKEIQEKINKLKKEKNRLKETYGEKDKQFLTRTFTFLLKPGDSEEEKKYNDDLYQAYLKNPYKVLQDALKNVMTFNPSGYFNAIQNGDTAKEFEFLNENLDKLELGFTLLSEIRDGMDEINNYGEHNGGAMYSDEFKKLYDIPSHSAFLYGGTIKKISLTSTDSYFTVPPAPMIDINDINLTGISPNILQAWEQIPSFGQDDEIIKAIKKHPELKVGDNFLINFKAIRTVDGKEEEVALQDAILNDKDVKFIKRPQEEIDILLNPIDKNYLKVVNGEITQEQYDDIELKKFLAEVEDFVTNPSKYHKGEPDFTKPLSDKEKKDIEEHYKNNIKKYNKYLPNDQKLKLDLKDLRARMNDPKQAEIYRRTQYIAEKEKKQRELFERYNSKMNIPNANHPLVRNLHQLLRIDNSKESSNFNQRLFKLYSKHPFEFGQAVLKGIYRADSSIYNSILKDDYERCKDFCDNYEASLIAFNQKNISTLMGGDGGLVEEFTNTNLARLIELKQELTSGFIRPELIFEIPNMTNDQYGKVLGRLNQEDADILFVKVTATDIKQTKGIIKSLKDKGYLDDKEPILAYKAIEVKDGKEKEISLIDAISKNSPNIKIEKRTEEEKEKILQFSKGIRKREQEIIDAKFEIVDKSENVRAKDSLAKHHDAIKKYMDFASNAKNGEERKLENSYDALLGLNCINNAIKFINRKLDTGFDNKEEILKTAKRYGFEVRGNSIKTFESIIGNESLKNIDINFFNKIEEKLTADEIIEFRKEVKGNGRLEFERNNVHVLDKKINEIKKNIPENLSQEEKEEYIKALDNINAKVIRKKEAGFIENTIDADSRHIKIEAKSELRKFVNPLDVSEKDKEVFVERDRKFTEGEINFKLENQEHHKAFADVYEKRPHIVIDEKVKNKIKGLADVVEEAGIFNDSKAGENGQKNYGFTPFFQLQYELDNLINRDTSSYTDEEKKQYREEVIKKSNEMNELEAKYDKVFEYIKKNFDMEKIITNQNIYSGRPPGGLLERWDNKNARIGVILNGFMQFLGAVKDVDSSVNEFLDDPEKVMRLYIEKNVNKVEKPYILPKEGNSLGKRLARATNYNETSFQLLDGVNFGLTRATEFVFAVDPDKDRRIQNIQSEALYNKGLQELIHGGSEFLVYDAFNPKPRYDNLVNILMFGDEAKNNIFEPCYEFYNHEFKKTMDLNLMNKYQEMKENPGKALENIANAVKDFISESAIINQEAIEGNRAIILPEHVAVAGKIALENMLKVNNMTLDDIKDLDVRNNIKAYIENPIKALGNMLGDNLGLDKEALELLENKTLEAAEAYNTHKIINFTEAFSKKMKEIDRSKGDITMYDVTNEHKIGFFEGFFNTKATKNYRNLIKAINGFENPNSKYYGKPEKVALAAQAYLDHKYKDGKTIDDLKGEAKERAKFCENLIASYKKSFVLEADLFLNKNVTDNKKEKIINQEEIIVDKALDNQKEVNNNLENEKEVDIIVDKEEPIRESVLNLEGDVDIENNKNKKPESTKTNTKVKVTEKEDVKNMD